MSHDARSITRTALALLSAQSITWASSVVGIVVLPRFLGPQDFGVFATALAINAVVSTVATFGTGPHIIKRSAREPAMAASLFVQGVALRAAAWVVLTVLLLPACAVFIDDPSARSVVLLVACAGLLTLVADTAIGSMQAMHAVGRPAALRALVGSIGQLVTWALLVLGHGVVMVAVLNLASAALAAGGTTLLFWSRFGGSVTVTFSDIRGLARAGMHYLSWDLALLVYGRVDQLMLAALVGTTAVGLYAFAYRLLAIPALVPAIVASAAYPALAATAYKDEVQFRSILAGAVRAVILSGMPAATWLFLLASDLTSLLAGSDFHGATVVVMLLAIHMPLVAIDTILGGAIVARDRQAVWARIGWALALFNPLTNLIAIPVAAFYWSNGAIGAAVATLFTESIMAGSAMYLMRRHLGVEMIAVVARVTLACVVMSLVAAVTRLTVGIWASIPAGCATYALLVIALRLIRPSDVSLALAAVKAKAKPAEVLVSV